MTFTTPFELPADHYFFVPQVQVTGGESPKPIAPPGSATAFPVTIDGVVANDLQEWIRNADLDPDAQFNATYSLTGETVAGIPELASLSRLGMALAGVGFRDGGGVAAISLRSAL